MKTKFYKLSIPGQYEAMIAKLADEAGTNPTGYLTSIIADKLNIQTRLEGRQHKKPVASNIADTLDN